MKTWRIGFLTIRGGAGALTALMIVSAIVMGVFREFTRNHLLLTPDIVVGRFEFWQLATFIPFPQPSALSIIFAALIFLGMGSQLEMRWGTPKFFRVIVGVTVAAAVLTTLLGLVIRDLGAYPIEGASVLTLVIWVAFGLANRHAPVNFWGLNVSGYMFALIGLGFSVLAGLYGRTWLIVVPDLLAAALTYLVVHEQFPASFWTRFRSWQLQRDLNKRSAHLRSIDGGQRNTGRDSDKYLH